MYYELKLTANAFMAEVIAHNTDGLGLYCSETETRGVVVPKTQKITLPIEAARALVATSSSAAPRASISVPPKAGKDYTNARLVATYTKPQLVATRLRELMELLVLQMSTLPEIFPTDKVVEAVEEGRVELRSKVGDQDSNPQARIQLRMELDHIDNEFVFGVQAQVWKQLLNKAIRLPRFQELLPYLDVDIVYGVLTVENTVTMNLDWAKKEGLVNFNFRFADKTYEQLKETMRVMKTSHVFCFE